MVAEPTKISNMATNNVKNPPKLDNCSSFESWEKAIGLWKMITDMSDNKKGPALILSLSDKDRDLALELDTTVITAADGVDKIIEKLGKKYKKDTIDTAYDTFESFIHFKKENMKMNDYVNEFEARYNKAKKHGFELTSSTRAYFLLNQCQLSEENKKLIKATISKLDFDEMKTKLLKVFGSADVDRETEEVAIKMENINMTEEETYYGNSGNFYSQRPYRGYSFTVNRGGRGNFNPSRGQRRTGNRRGVQHFHQERPRRTRCSICESVNHLAYNCPDKVYYGEENFNDDEHHEVVLYQSNLLTPADYEVFTAEASVSAILDSGASSTVAGRSWIESYIDGLTELQKDRVEYEDSYSTYKFGSDQRYTSLYRVSIPAKIGNTAVKIKTDVVETSIPLLLSKDAMKTAKTEINFEKDEVSMFGQKQDLKTTRSGHYAVHLNDSDKILKKINENENAKITLVTTKDFFGDKLKVAKKLHSQFGHPTKNKLIELIKRAGMQSDLGLIDSINKISKECTVCKEYRRPSPRPIVSLPNASKFNETVSMDLKSFHGSIILHLIDNLTRFSSAIVCKSKQPTDIVNGIVLCWVSLFGPPEKILVDNGGEFANQPFIELAESFNIRVLTTPAYSPWSNGIVERHNATLSETLEKVIAESKCTLEVGLAWALNAKNSLANMHGFSPYQLVMGRNPVMPSLITDAPPALESNESSEVVRRNLEALATARKSFIESETSNRLKRAVSHNIRPHQNLQFQVGDLVYFKRADSKKWKGPGRVLGLDSVNVLIKQGSYYYRVHKCRVIPDYKRQEADLDLCMDNSNKVNPSSDDTSSCESQEDEETSNEVPEQQISKSGASDETEKSLNEQNIKLKRGIKIKFQDDQGNWNSGEVLKRSGKATGQYKDFWYIKEKNSDEVTEYDTRNWKKIIIDSEVNNEGNSDDLFTEETHRSNDIFVNSAEVNRAKSEQILDAKNEEIDKWIEEEVFTKVSDVGQERITTTWVLSSKLKDNHVVTKARLVARGFQEEAGVRSDCPTCSKENIRMVIGVGVSKGWKINSLDVKAAFLQGKLIEREMFLEPPKEFKEEGILWKLRKVIYGLRDASRSWYLRVAEVLTSLGMEKLNCDGAVFYSTSKGGLDGVILVHVDDLLYFGSSEFHNNVMKPFKEKFKISRDENQTFKYVGIEITQTSEAVILKQTNYLESVKEDYLTKQQMMEKYRYVNEAEKRLFRQGVGQLGWIASISRPEASFMYCCLATVQSKPQVIDFVRLRKTIRSLKASEQFLKIAKLKMETAKIVAYSDASFANLAGGSSQLGYIIFLADDSGASIPLAWSSKKSKRVARSTLTAETLAAIEAVELALMMRQTIQTILAVKLPPISLFVDNKSLHDAAKTTNTLADKRLMIDMSALRQMVEKGELNIQWVSTKLQLADVLTKAGVNPEKLTAVLSSGCSPSC